MGTRDESRYWRMSVSGTTTRALVSDAVVAAASDASLSATVPGAGAGVGFGSERAAVTAGGKAAVVPGAGAGALRGTVGVGSGVAVVPAVGASEVALAGGELLAGAAGCGEDVWFHADVTDA